MQLTNKQKSIIARWIYVLTLGLLSYSIWHLILHTKASQVFLLFISNIYHSLPVVIQVGLMISCGFSLPWFLRKHRTYHIRHTLKNGLVHPPIYLAAFAACGYVIADNNILRESLEFTTLLQFSLGAMACLLYMQGTLPKNEPQNAANQETFNIKTWLEQETPITNRHYDLLGINAYAERIERLLSQPPVDGLKSHQIAIRGDFGTGKSSLCKIIENDLKKNDHFVFCHVDGWGRENKSFAGQIIEIIIDKLSEEIDASSLTLLPENYINALNGTGISGVIAISNLLNPTRKENPEIYLQKLDQLLATIEKKIVVIIEDFDRGPEPGKTINELASLMERLKGLENTHFILCLKGDHSTVIDKICDHIEDILPISYESIQRITHEFVGLIEDECTGNIHFPPKRNEYTFTKTIAPLIKNPRNLKKIIRRTYSAWENIKGEVYFYDLFHLNILRFSNLELFSLITNDIERLIAVKTQRETEKALIETITKLAIAEEEKNALTATALTFFITPYFGDTETAPEIKRSLNNYTRLISQSKNEIQRAYNNSIYMRNATTETYDKNLPSDREILAALHSTSPSKSILEKLEIIENENHYEAQIKRVVEWSLSIDKEDIHSQLAQVISYEFLRLQSPRTSLYFNRDRQFNYQNPRNKNSNIHTLCDIVIDYIDRILNLGLNQSKEETLAEIFKKIKSNNSSIALEMITHCKHMTTKEWMTKEILSDNQENNNIFKTIDFTDTKFLSNLYLITHNNSVDLKSVSSFHKKAFDLGLTIEKPLIPIILYHLDKSLIPPDYKFEETWKIDLLKKAILDFKYEELAEYQYQDELIEILKKWKKIAKNNETFFEQKEYR